MKAIEDYGTSSTQLDDDEDALRNRENDMTQGLTIERQTNLELAILSTINEIRVLKSVLENDLQNKIIDLSTFYQKHFKHNQVDNILMPFYVNMHSAALSEASENSISIDQVTIKGKTAGEIDALKTLQSLEEQWNKLLLQVDESLPELAEEEEKDPGEYLDAEKISLIDCERNQNVTLDDLLSPKYGRFTLFVLIRFFGCSVCLDHVRELVTRADEFEAKLVNIVIVCKGRREGGAKWKQLTGVTFPVLADETGAFVRCFHFGVSVWKMNNSKEFHARAMVRASGDDEFKAFVDDELHEFYQLGGNVVLDTKGKVIYVFKSAGLDERPTADELLRNIPKVEIDPFVRQRVEEDKIELNGGVMPQTAEKSGCSSCTIL
uniref:Alkyl hydroperoxide reductase subunit C/ Thiol specific antioxidant domain-containing protein n=1 Tax=Plectus sambesii TaxID=2011161 RepID=A0A914VTC3_9BILA